VTEVGSVQPASGDQKSTDDKEAGHGCPTRRAGNAFGNANVPWSITEKKGKAVIPEHQGSEQQPQEIKVISAVIRSGLLWCERTFR